METEVISALVSTAANAERLGMLGFSFVIIGVLVIIHIKTLKNMEKNITTSNAELVKVIKEMQENNKIQSSTMKAQIKSSIAFVEWVKENSIGVKVRLDNIDNKLNEIDKKIIALK